MKFILITKSSESSKIELSNYSFAAQKKTLESIQSNIDLLKFLHKKMNKGTLKFDDNNPMEILPIEGSLNMQFHYQVVYYNTPLPSRKDEKSWNLQLFNRSLIVYHEVLIIKTKNSPENSINGILKYIDNSIQIDDIQLNQCEELTEKKNQKVNEEKEKFPSISESSTLSKSSKATKVLPKFPKHTLTPKTPKTPKNPKTDKIKNNECPQNPEDPKILKGEKKNKSSKIQKNQKNKTNKTKSSEIESNRLHIESNDSNLKEPALPLFKKENHSDDEGNEDLSSEEEDLNEKEDIELSEEESDIDEQEDSKKKGKKTEKKTKFTNEQSGKNLDFENDPETVLNVNDLNYESYDYECSTENMLLYRGKKNVAT